MELLLGARVGKFPVAPRPDHDISAAAGHRMTLAVRHLRAIGCQADGIISDEDDLVEAVRSETRSHDYARVVLAMGRPRGSALARGLHLDPVRRLRGSWGRAWSSSRSARRLRTRASRCDPATAARSPDPETGAVNRDFCGRF